MYSGTCPTAAPMPRSLMPWGQPKFSSTPSAPVSSTCARMFFQRSSSQATISETISARPGQRRLTRRISAGVGGRAGGRVGGRGGGGEKFVVVQADHAAVLRHQRRVARAIDVGDRRVFAQ